MTAEKCFLASPRTKKCWSMEREQFIMNATWKVDECITSRAVWIRKLVNERPVTRVEQIFGSFLCWRWKLSTLAKLTRMENESGKKAVSTLQFGELKGINFARFFSLCTLKVTTLELIDAFHGFRLANEITKVKCRLGLAFLYAIIVRRCLCR